MRMAMIFAAAWLAAAPAIAQSGAPPSGDAPLFDPITGYRLAHYRGVVTTVPEGVRRIDVTQARTAWRAGALFLDVNPAPGARRDPESGRWTLAEPHASIPRAHWFAESGRGVLAPEVERGLLLGVHRLSARRPNRAIVVFCQADCWMSWNAALRLHRAGFRDVQWFAEGLDGWKEAGLAVSPAIPER